MGALTLVLVLVSATSGAEAAKTRHCGYQHSVTGKWVAQPGPGGGLGPVLATKVSCKRARHIADKGGARFHGKRTSWTFDSFRCRQLSGMGALYGKARCRLGPRTITYSWSY